MRKLTIILLFVFSPSIHTNAQQTPAQKQTKSILILNATAHLGNGKTIDNSAIGFKDGKIIMVSDSKTLETNPPFDITIDAKGKHIYPGFILPNSTLGLVEIDAVKASDDESEIGNMNPNVRSIIAYNAASKVIETCRPNGILIAQITPQGGQISGTSSIVQLDAWNWKDALIKEDDGIHLNFPSIASKSGSWFEPGNLIENKDYNNQIDEIRVFLSSAKAYLSAPSKDRNIVLESMKGLFDNTQTLFISANEQKQIIDAIQLSQEIGIKKVVIVGGFEAYKVVDLLKKNQIGVFLRNVHDMPIKEDQDIDMPYKMAKILVDNGIIVGLENSGSKERMNSRNLPFLAGTCAAYGLDKEQALQLITSNTAKLLGVDQQLGTLELGKDATLFISEGDALDMRSNKLTDAFIQGRKIDLESHQTKLYEKYKTKYNQQ
nr:amidohydrolase family protein [uncultured Flavobacterium sp.]